MLIIVTRFCLPYRLIAFHIRFKDCNLPNAGDSSGSRKDNIIWIAILVNQLSTVVQMLKLNNVIVRKSEAFPLKKGDDIIWNFDLVITIMSSTIKIHCK